MEEILNNGFFELENEELYAVDGGNGFTDMVGKIYDKFCDNFERFGPNLYHLFN